MWLGSLARPGRSRKAVVGVALVGALLTVLVSLQTYRTEQAARVQTLVDQADELALDLGAGIDNDFQALDDLVIAEESVGGLNQAQFETYANRTVALHPELLGLSWVPRVPLATRASFEREAQLRGLVGFRITELDASNNLVVAAERPEYFPVYYLNATSSVGPWLGYDIASSPLRQEALQVAEATDHVGATGPLTLFQPGVAMHGFLAMRVVRDTSGVSGEDRAPVRGYVQAPFESTRLVESALALQHTAGLHLEIVDLGLSRSPAEAAAVYASANAADGSPLREIELEIAGRTWRISASPEPGAIAISPFGSPLLVFAAGSLVTVLLMVLMQLGMTRAQLRRARDDARTADALRASEAHFRALIENSADVFVQIDLDGRVSYASPSVQRILGYASGELVGTNVFRLVHPQDRGMFQAGFAPGAFHEGQLATHELQLRCADGSWQSVEATTHILLDNPAVKGIVVTARDVTLRKQTEDALHRLAFFDPLTGLANRAMLQEQINAAFDVARREDSVFALAVLDLDRFRQVNDGLGHQAGDALLQEVALRLRQTALAGQTIARLGGDEFALLLPCVDDERGACRAVREFLLALEAPCSIDGNAIGIFASAGIALFGTHGQDAATLMRCADVAMAAAKRDQLGLAVYQPDQSTASSDDLGLYAELRTAIATGELVLHYQPKISLSSATPEGVEALVRWQHPQRGLLSPDIFIALAERGGLMPSLTRWVVGAALQQMRLWHEQGIRLAVSINLSASALNDLELAQEIVHQVGVFHASAQHLVVEVTESAILRNFDQARAALVCLRAAGIRVSIDDFGTGQSSLAYLKALPLDELKIDRSFIKDMLTDTHDEAIVRSVIDLGHRLGLKVTAEGVEAPATFEALRRFGCDLAQGYWMGRPLPSHKLRGWFAEWDVLRMQVAHTGDHESLQQAATGDAGPEHLEAAA